MATVKVESLKNLQQVVTTAGHAFVADEPPGTGDGLGPDPYELLLAAHRHQTGPGGTGRDDETGGMSNPCAGEILLTSMDCDGTKQGYDVALTHAIAEAVRIPVIASGGGPDGLSISMRR